jgi:hypothetical protein
MTAAAVRVASQYVGTVCNHRGGGPSLCRRVTLWRRLQVAYLNDTAPAKSGASKVAVASGGQCPLLAVSGHFD